MLASQFAEALLLLAIAPRSKILRALFGAPTQVIDVETEATSEAVQARKGVHARRESYNEKASWAF